MSKFGRSLTLFTVGALTLAALFTPSPLNAPAVAQVTQTNGQATRGDAPAQDAAALAGPVQILSSAAERPLGHAPVLRTPNQVAAAEAVNRLKKVPPRHGRPRLRPTMDQITYESLKAIANINVPAFKVGDSGRGAPDALAVERLAPPVAIGVNVNGDSEAGLNPPDTHGAVGASHYVQVTNSKITRFSKTGTLLSSVTLASFFGYTLTTVFDPRVVYDIASQRWIVMAEAFAESATVQRCFIAVSTTNSATGSYFVYKFDINLANNDDFFDYPQLGYDKNDIIVTANIFGPSSYRGSRVYAFPKAAMYAGQTVGFTQFAGAALNFGTISPPVVLDLSANAFLVSAPNGGSALRVYQLADTGSPRLTFVGTVPVGTYSVPPDAPQPGACSTQKLDTVDSRFVNASTQVGTSLFNAHTISVAGFPTPRYYEINTGTRTLVRSGTFFASRTSYDFNVSIAANAAKDMVVNWSSTDPANNVNAQVRFGGRRAADPTQMGLGTVLFQSPTCAKEGTAAVLRWGDYSAVSVDPANSLHFWIVNEKMNSQTQWGSRIGRVNF